MKNFVVIGSFSKLLKNFIKKHKPNMISTYINRDWSIDKNVFSINGFKKISKVPANYWYFKSDNIRINRSKFSKSKLIKKGYDKNKSEKVIISELGYNRIWDCGKLKFSLKI